MKLFLFLMLSFTIAFNLSAQRNDVLFINSQTLSDNPYEGIEGSPYVFKDWKKGKIYPINNDEGIENVLLNYNGYTQNFEVKRGDRFIALNENWYNTVDILNGTGLIAIYKTGLLPNKKNLFTKLVFYSKAFHIIEEHYFSLITIEREQYAKTIEIKKFVKHNKLYFVQNGEKRIFKLKKKKVIALFPELKKELEKYIKQKRLDLTTEEGAIKLFEYVNQRNSVSILTELTSLP